MGTCQKSQKNTSNPVKKLNETEFSSQFRTIRDLMHFFDQICLEKLNFPDLSSFLSKHINKNSIVKEGKTWIAINEVKSILNNKSLILIRNFNQETDAAIQLIYLLKQLIEVSLEAQELQTTFDENAVELFLYYQTQLVQISIEVLLAVNTLIRKQEQWWMDNYFNWRSNYIQSMFKIEQPIVDKIELIQPFFQFIHLLKLCAKQICNQQKSPDLIEIDIKAQQEILDQFYNQIRNSFLQNQSTLADSINMERQLASKTLGQKLQVYNLYIQKKNYTT